MANDPSKFIFVESGTCHLNLVMKVIPSEFMAEVFNA